MKNAAKITIFTLFVGVMSMASLRSNAHCEIPCGIYGDSLRVALIYEHIETIEKSMNMINELSVNEKVDYNQLVRWVVNKEEHANKLQEIVSQYFLHQRIKPVEADNQEAYKKYLTQLELLHKLLVYAMKSKQSTDLEVVAKLRDTVHEFEHVYFHKHDEGHSH